jgi:exosortase/archaeosortase family protein
MSALVDASTKLTRRENVEAASHLGVTNNLALWSLGHPGQNAGVRRLSDIVPAWLDANGLKGAIFGNDPASVRREQARFVIGFGVIAAVLLGLYAFPYAELGLSETWFNGYLSAYARLVGRVLDIFESGLRVEDTLITGRYSLRIVKTCDAMEANILFAAAVLAIPGPWSRKLNALALGLFALIAVNVIRISSLYYAGIHAPRAFGVLHEEIWPAVLVVFAGFEFLLWARWIREGDPAKASAAQVGP